MSKCFQDTLLILADLEHSFIRYDYDWNLSSGLVLLALDSRLIRAVWRIPRTSNTTDNFAHGTSGNLIGKIDVDSGRVGEVLKSVGMNRAVAETHPDTGKLLTGVTLPNWQESVKLCSSAASALPAIRLQNWDVAMCPDGPMLIEVNAAGDVDISQFAYRAGLRTVIP